MKVLVVGGGGREHALAWKIGQSKRVEQVFVAPGNAGTAQDDSAPIENVEIGDTDIAHLLAFAKKNSIGLTVVGPEASLAAGIVDAFSAEGLRIFGPNKQATELEASKVFCKNLLRHADVPTADFHTFRDAESALLFLDEREDSSLVIKADGLAAGKGVIVCANKAEALEAVKRITGSDEFGAAGKQLVIEDRLVGQEASVLAITDGHTILIMPAAQDHKPAHDGDKGPNTGGMGAYSPTPLVTDELMRSIEEKVLVPTVHQLKRMRRPFKGVLYAGLMITKQGLKVLEYNVRFGDPECQPLVMRLQSDLVDVLEAAADGRLDEAAEMVWDPRPAVCVVMASEGYPGEYTKGHPIRGLTEAAAVPNAKVFHAGTKLVDGQVVTNGGRVLGVTALGNSISAAKLQAYTAVKCIRWNGAWCRKDISDKALE
ncbi:phosphoribosylamine--glycine ligase [Bythopirellula polymerisocia]|uniref:Phosphoribosylamine--glycine ligase n=1 Tax=Bythopirellula polymerisocia TaxID=2528003 RepID=A0A5C6CHA6_9BACT|nr:phosphoribosylamine--glycine ligase [Bythopirellula polymerisocia]TWU23572.1 Phosphoribosylamine--glycine ligase [Bythopirellula polymerisocia]